MFWNICNYCYYSLILYWYFECDIFVISFFFHTHISSSQTFTKLFFWWDFSFCSEALFCTVTKKCILTWQYWVFKKSAYGIRLYCLCPKQSIWFNFSWCSIMSYPALFHDTNTHFKNLKQGKLHLKQEELLHHSWRIFIYFFVSRWINLQGGSADVCTHLLIKKLHLNGSSSETNQQRDLSTTEITSVWITEEDAQ